MLRCPDQPPVVDLLAPILTALKWVFLGAGFVLLFGGIIVEVWRWTRQKSRSTTTG
jgi:hypothetical protein